MTSAINGRKGASIYDVRTEGGVPSKADIVSNRSKEGCVNLRTRGEGVKKSEHFAGVIYGSPQMTSAINGRKDERQWKFRPEMRFFSLSSPFPKPISKLTCDTSQWPNFSRGGKTWGKFLWSRTRLEETKTFKTRSWGSVKICAVSFAFLMNLFMWLANH